MKLKTKPVIWGVSLLLCLCLGTTSVCAQSLNNRETADPKTKAKTTRALVSARSQAAKQGKVSLNRKTINMDCQPVKIGAQEEDENKRRVNPRKEEVVVVPGDVINICR